MSCSRVIHPCRAGRARVPWPAARAVLVGLAVALAPGWAPAAVLFVTTTADAGPGSLRAAIAALPPGEPNEIRLQLPGTGVQTIVLQSSLPSLQGSRVLIDGAQPLASVSIDGQGQHRIFHWPAGADLTLRHLRLAGGAGQQTAGCVVAGGVLLLESMLLERCRSGAASANAEGAAVWASGTVTVRASRFTDNVAQAANWGGAQGGAALYMAGGTLLVEDSVFAGNRAQPGADTRSYGGAIRAVGASVTLRRTRFLDNGAIGADGAGGALSCLDASCTVEDSFFGGNRAGASGGAVLAWNSAVALSNTTFHDNAALTGGALRLGSDAGAQSTVRLRNLTFSDNAALDGAGGAHLSAFNDVEFTEVANSVFGGVRGGLACSLHPDLHRYDGPGHNALAEATCEPILGTPQVGALAVALGLGAPRLTGAVETLDVAHGSPLVDGGSPLEPGSGEPGACTARDANGVRRPQDGDADGSGGCDIGAGELRDRFRSDLFLDDPPTSPRVVVVQAPPGVAELGFEIADLGDVNGDGLDDLGLTAPIDAPGSYRGAGWILFGRPGGHGALLDLATLVPEQGVRLLPEPAGRQLLRITRAGDVDGDGLGDVLLGADGVGAVSGAVFLLFGDAQWPASVALAAPDGERLVRIEDSAAPGWAFGHCLAGPGDVDGDGRDDLLLGSPMAGSAGMVQVVYAPPAGTAWPAVLDLEAGALARLRISTQAPDRIGERCAAAGDVDGDGRSDLLLGSPGRQAVLFGPVVGGLHVVMGRGPGTLDLSSLAPAQGQTFIGTGQDTGGVLSGGADLDGDGRAEVLAGTLAQDFQPGTRNQAFLLAGLAVRQPPVTLDAGAAFVWSRLEGDGAGRGLVPLRLADDLDGDARADLLAATPFSPEGGRVSVLTSSGRSAAQWPAALLDIDADARALGGYRIVARTGLGVQSRLGAALASPDLDGNGLADVALAAPGENRVYLLLQRPQADLQVAFRQLPASVPPGGALAGQLVCTNLGPATAVAVQCGDASGVLQSVQCSPALPVASLAPGASVVCDIAIDALYGGGVTLAARGWSGTQDPDPANNLASASVPVMVPPAAVFADGFER